jgi:hypothetical protein
MLHTQIPPEVAVTTDCYQQQQQQHTISAEIHPSQQGFFYPVGDGKLHNLHKP